MLNLHIARLSPSSTSCWKTTLPHQNTFLSFNFFSSSRLSEPKFPKIQQQREEQEKNDSFTVSYLRNSCGLSPKLAIEASKRVRLRDTTNPDSVLNLLRNYGFSKTHISKLVGRRPRVLLANPETTLLPKLAFFRSIGLSSIDIPELISDAPKLAECSLKKALIPRYEVLRSVFVDDGEIVLKIIKYSKNFSNASYDRNLLPNIEVLRQAGVPQSSISFLVTNYSQIAFTKHKKFLECVNSAEEMGLDPSRITFIEMVQYLIRMKKSNYEAKLRVYERCGWSKDVTILAFKRFRTCMSYSEEKITKMFKILVDEMGWSSEDIAISPMILSYSLKKRIIPRCSVVKILRLKGLVKKELSLTSFITIDEKKFLDRYVIRFLEDVPQLMEIYNGQIDPLCGMQS
ncbi:hypothetical protein L6164_029292 [Bauhinia variegata]|uniref:Uncharacterized protein n=1 Tax=Bauhinia variegata TaxID=167791 RepID=A0ACB9L8W6_BAUVA|nr:hypothetical protein L6164_029292 [Bauhinia variegata]